MSLELLKSQLKLIQEQKEMAISNQETIKAFQFIENEKEILKLIEQYPKITYNDYTPDSIVQTVLEKYIKRAEMGEKKYGKTLDREDLNIKDYLIHAQEEAMDLSLYLQKIIDLLDK